MANRLLEDPRAFEKELVIVSGSFQVAAGSPDTITNIVGKGVSTVVRSDTGKYTITLSDVFTAFRSGHVELLMAAATNLVGQIISTDVASAKTVVITTHAAGTPTEFTDTTADSTATIYFTFYLKNSSV